MLLTVLTVYLSKGFGTSAYEWSLALVSLLAQRHVALSLFSFRGLVPQLAQEAGRCQHCVALVKRIIFP